VLGSAFDLAGQLIVVTGAASGIGAATARVCASLGAMVVAVDAAPIRAGTGVAEAVRLDVRDRAAVEALAARQGAVDALVVSAAICPFDDWQDEGWDAVLDRVLDVNVKGAIHCARAFMPGMMARGSGRMVLVGSLAGKTGGLIASAHYPASKGGLHALVRWLAQRGGPAGVQVNGVAPASIETPMMAGRPVDLGRIPLRRMGSAAEVAWPIAFLCSGAASYVCGTVLDVNGGVWMG
jgi:NAD(P)-dependent dehydrogenase (short-subunit alcohol dehydrogenase family)